MVRKFKNLEEAHAFIQNKITHSKLKDIKNFDCDLFLEFMVACQKYIEEEIFNYAKTLGYLKTHPYLRVKVYKPYVESFPRWAGRCGGELIEINLLYVITGSPKSTRMTMVHELCHLSILEHSFAFFELELKNLKEVGLLDKNIPFEEAFYPPDCRGFYYLRNSDSNSIFFTSNNDRSVIYSKLETLFRHKIFDLKIRYMNYRYIRKEYECKMKGLCEIYGTNINNFCFSWHN